MNKQELTEARIRKIAREEIDKYMKKYEHPLLLVPFYDHCSTKMSKKSVPEAAKDASAS